MRPVPTFRHWPSLASVLCLALAACSEPGAEVDDGATLRGELVTYVLDFSDHSETQHLVRLPGGEERRLILSAPTELTAGDRVRVWGHPAGDDFAVTRLEREPGAVVEAHRAALIDGKKKPVKRWAFVLVDANAKGVNISQAQAQDRLFSATNPKSMKNYYHEISYGLQELDGQVFGPIPYTTANACDSSGVAKALRPMIEGTFDQYLWYFGTRQMCDWAGLAALGTADRPQRDSWYNASSGCVVLAQEPGHNFGMVHSSSLSCTSNGMKVPFALPGAGTCVHSEYGNTFDPMGGGSTCFHMDGFQKAYQDWITGCNVVKVTKSGTFTIFPLEKACNGVQLLQIPFGPAGASARLMTLTNGPMSRIANYYLELRAPIGVDTALTPRVFVTVGDDIGLARGRGGRNWLLDMTPETATKADAALPVGRAYADPATDGPKFTVLSADATKAVIQVEVPGGGAASDAPGAGVCDDMTPFAAPGPDTCDAPPTSLPTPEGGASADARPAARDGSAGTGGIGGTGGGGEGGAGGSSEALPDAGSAPPKTGGKDASAPAAEEDAGEDPPSRGKNVHGSLGCQLGGAAPGTSAVLVTTLLGLALAVRRRRR
jgi:hypothetical protein